MLISEFLMVSFHLQFEFVAPTSTETNTYNVDRIFYELVVDYSLQEKD